MLEKLPPVIGRALKNVKAGAENTLYFADEFWAVPDVIKVTSPAFNHDQPLPVRFTADGESLSPSLAWHAVPQNARGVILVIEDADSPTPSPVTHAIVLGLSLLNGELKEGALPSADHQGQPHAMGYNAHLRLSYLPPDPPPGHGLHRYLFQFFALDLVTLGEDHPTTASLRDAMPGHVVAKGLLIGTYRRP